MPDVILGTDQGTTGSTALLIGHELGVHGRCTIDLSTSHDLNVFNECSKCKRTHGTQAFM